MSALGSMALRGSWLLLAVALLPGRGVAGLAAPAVDAESMPRYAHIFVIVAENKGYAQIIGAHSLAPHLNRLAQAYGLASEFYAEVHPSEANYIAMLGGDTFGIHDDDAFYCKPGLRDASCGTSTSSDYADHTVTAPSLMDQLRQKGLSWKGYMEDLPEPGSLAIGFPTDEHPLPGQPTQLYAAKHNGFVNFQTVQRDPLRAARLVGFDQLDRDLAAGALPNYAHIVPNQCNDMHGRDAAPAVPVDCTKGNVEQLIARGDRVIGQLVDRIMQSQVWKATDNSAIVITFDESDRQDRRGQDQGCCGFDPSSNANFGGGHIATIVITNHGARSLVDPHPYNHYSLLRTTEAAFGIDRYLAHAADSDRGVSSMLPLFAVSH